QTFEKKMDPFVDSLIENEAENEFLLSKPTCFIIIGKPGVGKSTLARKLAQAWRCVLIDGIAVLSNKHIKYSHAVLILIFACLCPGYVLSCLPSMSEEYLKIPEQINLIKGLKMPPDIIINIKCTDNDLINRLAGMRQHPHTGRVLLREQWEPVKKETPKKKSEAEEENEQEEEEEEQIEEEGQEVSFYHLVQLKENSPEEAHQRILFYKDTILRFLEDYMEDHEPQCLFELDGNKDSEELLVSVMARLECMALRRAAVPVRLLDKEEAPEEMDTEELLRILSSCKTVVPGFRWHRSRWSNTCPVALKMGKIIKGKPEFSVGFLDKIYVLSSQEALQKFMVNPRRYLLPPMPRPPCRMAVIGPPCSGKSTMCTLLAKHYGAVLIDLEKLMKPILVNVRQEMLEKARQDAVSVALEKVKLQKTTHNSDMFLLCLFVTAEQEVTEDHPEVCALVDEAMKQAEQTSVEPTEDMCVDVLLKIITEVCPSYSRLSTMFFTYEILTHLNNSFMASFQTIFRWSENLLSLRFP
uniref:Uncharacterized protein n=1 Tax=Astyanax mexicanus TaxID=7994 RepID=A0A8B9H3N5_ASTMX